MFQMPHSEAVKPRIQQEVDTIWCSQPFYNVTSAKMESRLKNNNNNLTVINYYKVSTRQTWLIML